MNNSFFPFFLKKSSLATGQKLELLQKEASQQFKISSRHARQHGKRKPPEGRENPTTHTKKEKRRLHTHTPAARRSKTKSKGGDFLFLFFVTEEKGLSFFPKHTAATAPSNHRQERRAIGNFYGKKKLKAEDALSHSKCKGPRVDKRRGASNGPKGKINSKSAQAIQPPLKKQQGAAANN